MSAARITPVASTDATAEPTADAVRWVTSTVLAALWLLAPRAGATFFSDELDRLVPRLTTEQRQHATTKLIARGFLQHERVLHNGASVVLYTVTAEGQAAIDAVAEGRDHKSGPKGTRKGNPDRADALVTRLWRLMRMRKRLDAVSAARVLCDAGDDAHFRRVRQSCTKYLKRWSDAKVVVLSDVRVKGADDAPESNGAKVYVLLRDPGPAVPKWHADAKAKAKTADGAESGAGAAQA